MTAKLIVVALAVVLIIATFAVSLYIIKINTNPVPDMPFWKTVVPQGMSKLSDVINNTTNNK